MVKCVLKACKNNNLRQKKKDGVSYFKFPRNSIQREKWRKVVAIDRGDEYFKPNDTMVVCSDHFADSDVYYCLSGMKLNKKLAVPVLNVCERPSTSVPGTSTSKRQRGDKRHNVLPCYDDDSSESDDDDSGDVTNYSERTLDIERVNVTLPEQDEVVPTGYICNVCSSDIKGFRSTCLECADCNLCAACEARGEHSSHYVLRIPAAKAQVDNDKVVAMIRKHIADLQKLKEEISEAEATIKNEIIVKEEAMDEEPAEHYSEDFQSIPVMSYSIGVKEEVPNQDSQYLFFTTNPARTSNSESAHPVQREVNESWTSVGHVVNDALVPNVAQASSQSQEQDPRHTVHKPFTE